MIHLVPPVVGWGVEDLPGFFSLEPRSGCAALLFRINDEEALMFNSLGSILPTLSMLAAPMLLGSLWALVPAIISAALYVVRVYLEDKLLRVEVIRL